MLIKLPATAMLACASCALVVGGSTLHAATPDAWKTHSDQVIGKCIVASGLNGAYAGGELIEFDDRVGHTVLLIVGRYPQPHMSNQTGRVLCLYDKQTRTAYASAADQLITRTLTKSVSFEGTRWELTQIDDGSELLNAHRRAHLVFERKGGRLSGFGGCNRLMGTYRLDRDAITVGNIASTRMACEGSADVETKLMAALDRVRMWKITGHTLELFDAGRAVVARFVPGTPRT